MLASGLGFAATDGQAFAKHRILRRVFIFSLEQRQICFIVCIITGEIH